MLKRMPAALAAITTTVIGAGAALAAQPEDWGIYMQDAATPGAEQLHSFHELLLWVIILIAVFVTALLGYVMWRFRASRNPNPSQTTHNTLIEVAWTVVPVVILVLLAIPSFSLLYFLDRTENPELTIKVTGNQWYWSYEYPDQGGIGFLSNMLPDDQLAEGQPRLLSVNNPLVVPVDTNVQLLITSQDVLHSFAMPAFAVKMDAVKGRTNESWFNATAEGVYYGQCSELCGKDHAFMPIEIHVVSQDAFAQWVAEKQAELGIESEQPTSVAALD
ncbi:MAG: cytochrome c oxidase subunit II [Alphaproteobacteria bacterium]